MSRSDVRGASTEGLRDQAQLSCDADDGKFSVVVLQNKRFQVISGASMFGHLAGQRPEAILGITPCIAITVPICYVTSASFVKYVECDIYGAIPGAYRDRPTLVRPSELRFLQELLDFLHTCRRRDLAPSRAG
jgi:hypothetical protein